MKGGVERNMLHVIVLNGVVIEVLELGKVPWDKVRRLSMEGEYKVEYFHTCTHKNKEEHDPECWVQEA